LILLLLATTGARAAIRITESRFEQGLLIVRGQTAPNQDVTLDGQYKAKADGGGHFEFQVPRHRPPSCMSDITAGDDSYSAVIAGCFLSSTSEDSSVKRTSTSK
jgi:hypothetical protein